METIYREELLEHYKNPQNWGALADPTIWSTQNNPMCGDILTVTLKIENDKVIDIKFTGDACAVSVAAASLLSEDIKGRTLQEISNLSKEYLLKLIGVNLTTSRVKCAMLSLDTVKSAITKYDEK